MTWHQTIIMGNLGNDPELKYLQSGRAVCNFSVAVNERWTDRQTNEKREKTTWYRVAAWGPLGETCNTYLAKGRQVLVIGTVEARGYINNAGEPAAALELRALEVRFMSGTTDMSSNEGGGNRQNNQDDFAPPQNDIDDIPF